MKWICGVSLVESSFSSSSKICIKINLYIWIWWHWARSTPLHFHFSLASYRLCHSESNFWTLYVGLPFMPFQIMFVLLCARWNIDGFVFIQSNGFSWGDYHFIQCLDIFFLHKYTRRYLLRRNDWAPEIRWNSHVYLGSYLMSLNEIQVKWISK